MVKIDTLLVAAGEVDVTMTAKTSFMYPALVEVVHEKTGTVYFKDMIAASTKIKRQFTLNFDIPTHLAVISSDSKLNVKFKFSDRREGIFSKIFNIK